MTFPIYLTIGLVLLAIIVLFYTVSFIYEMNKCEICRKNIIINNTQNCENHKNILHSKEDELSINLLLALCFGLLFVLLYPAAIFGLLIHLAINKINFRKIFMFPFLYKVNKDNKLRAQYEKENNLKDSEKIYR